MANQNLNYPSLKSTIFHPFKPLRLNCSTAPLYLIMLWKDKVELLFINCVTLHFILFI